MKGWELLNRKENGGDDIRDMQVIIG